MTTDDSHGHTGTRHGSKQQSQASGGPEGRVCGDCASPRNR